MIKEEQIVKLVTVTITDIFAQNELVTHKLLAVELLKIGNTVRVKFMIENSTLPSVDDNCYIVDLYVTDLQEWIEEGVAGFVEKLESKLAEALQVKTEREHEQEN